MLGKVLAALLIAVPVWPVLAFYASALGLAIGTPMVLLIFTGGLLLACGWIGRIDGWAGTLGVYVILRAFPYSPGTFEVTTAIIVGLLVYAASASQRQRLFTNAILIAGTFTAAYMIGEAILTWRGTAVPLGGGIGNTNFVGAFLAISSAVVPVPILPLWMLGIVASHSALSALACAVCLLLRFRTSRWTVLALSGVVPATLLLRAHAIGSVSSLQSTVDRLAVWQWGLTEWGKAPLFGHGAGAWLAAHLHFQAQPTVLFEQAHNEWIQLGDEYGLVAVVLVAGWCWTHRRAVLSVPWGPALAAILIESLGMFPFQIPAVALLCLVCMGQATREVTPCC